MNPPGAHLPNQVMVLRHSTGVTYSLARNSFLNTSMRLECAICGTGAEFPRASGRRCLTFPHSVYSAHRFSSLSTGFTDSPPPRLTTYCRSSVLSWGTADTASISLHVQCDPISHCTGTNFQFGWTLQYFCILPGQLFSNSPSDKLSSVSSYMGFASCQLLGFSMFHARYSRANYFHPRRERSSLAWESGLLTNRLAETAMVFSMYLCLI